MRRASRICGESWAEGVLMGTGLLPNRYGDATNRGIPADL
jgi:hypothetical protein